MLPRTRPSVVLMVTQLAPQEPMQYPDEPGSPPGMSRNVTLLFAHVLPDPPVPIDPPDPPLPPIPPTPVVPPMPTVTVCPPVGPPALPVSVPVEPPPEPPLPPSTAPPNSA